MSEPIEIKREYLIDEAVRYEINRRRHWPNRELVEIVDAVVCPTLDFASAVRRRYRKLEGLWLASHALTRMG